MPMKKINAFLILFLCIGSAAFAQDTVVVKSFHYNSLTRDTMVNFPAPGDTYEKILMSYNMRCHGGTVSGSGNNNGPHQGGCGEWDYSCNTYLWDSSRVDSLYSYTASHGITGHSGGPYNYSLTPTFSFVETHQQDVVDNGSNLSTHLVHNVDFPMPFLIPTHEHSGKMQYLYDASELNSAGVTAGDIHGIQLFSNNSTEEAGFVRISMKNVSDATLDEFNVHNQGFTEVYFRNTTFVPNANDLYFYQPFIWDGTSNVLVEISTTNSTLDQGLQLEGGGGGVFQKALWSFGDMFPEFSGQRLDIDTNGMGNISSEITVMAWVYGNEALLPANTYMAEGVDAQGNRQFNVHLPWSNSRVYFDCGNDGSGYDRIDKAANVNELEGQWNHWAFTKNASTGEMKIYLNGQLWHSGTGKTKLIDLSQFTVGHSALGNGVFYGKINEFSVWKKELDAQTILDHMLVKIENNHPNYADLVAYYDFDENNGLTMNNLAPTGGGATFDRDPVWQYDRGDKINKFFEITHNRLDLAFFQGAASFTVNLVTEMDSLENSINTVTEYAISPNYGTSIDDDIIANSVNDYWPAGTFNIVDESGNVVGSKTYTADGTINIGELTYYRRFPAKYELMSFVTPYGNNLNLGMNGKTYWFDVTDFAPVLLGDKRITMERGGQWQEEMDIQFHFIKGTPSREVIDIQPIWRDASSNYANINSGRTFEDRQITLNPAGSSFKIRSSITGHGQEGEFIPRNHSLNVDGGATEFTWQVWKQCGWNPVHPQGGTWVYDRAGWCPGMATDVQESYLDAFASPGQTITVDYNMDVASGDSRYIVNHLLVTYGEPNFQVDGEIVEVQRPSNRTEYARVNPACSQPIVVIRNNGTTTMTSAKISYQVAGGTALTFDWTGSLEYLETEEVVLPVNDVSFWTSSTGESIFEVSIVEVNGASTDEYANNNSYKSEFTPFAQFSGELSFRYRTNNEPEDNHLYLYDNAGNLVFENSGWAANTMITDELSLSPGCYTLLFTDSANDGLTWWANPNQGSGFFQVREGNSIKKNFLQDFGSGFQWDFYSAGSVGLEENEKARYAFVAPNPSTGEFTVHMNGAEGKEAQIQITDNLGKIVKKETVMLNGQIMKHQIDLGQDPNGVYIVTVTIDTKRYTTRLVKM